MREQHHHALQKCNHELYFKLQVNIQRQTNVARQLSKLVNAAFMSDCSLVYRPVDS